MALPIGIVKSVEGIAIDVNTKGQEKVLKAGDVINIEDTIDTLGAASKVILALSDGQEIVVGGNDGLFLDKSVYSTDSFGNDAVASSEILKSMLPGESVEAIQQALLKGEDINNLDTTAAGQTASSQLGASGEAQYLQGGEESNVTSTLLNSDVNQNVDTTQITGNSVQYVPGSIGDINDGPVAVDDRGVAQEEPSGAESEIAPAVGNVLSNDIDNNDAHSQLTVIDINGNDVSSSGDTVIVGTYGTLTIHSDGTYTYVADNTNPTVYSLGEGENLQESFVYTVADNDSVNPKTDTGTLSITIAGANDAPVLTVHNLSVSEDGPSISGAASFTDVDLHDTHTFSVSSLNPGEGSVSIDSSTGVYTYKPEGDFQSLAVGETATVTFDVTVADNNGATSTKPVVVTIVGANDAPILSAEYTSGSINDDISTPTLTDSGTIAFTDVDLSDTHTVSVTGDSSQLGTLNAVVSESPDSSSGTVDWVYSVPSSETQYLGAGETKTESFNVTVSDGHGGVSTQTVDITIVGTNDQPVVTDVDVNGSGFLDRFTGDSTSATYYNNGSNSYAGMDYATVPNDRVQRIDSTHAEFALDTKLPSGSEDWDGARIYLHQGEVLTLTSNSGSNDYYLGIDDSDHTNGTPDPVTGAFRWDVLALTTDAGQSVSLTANSDGWYYIGTGAINGPDSPYGLYDTTVTITGESGSIIYEVDTGLNTFTSTFPAGQDADANDALTYDIVDDSLSVTTSSSAVITNLGVEVTDANTGEYKVVGDFNALAVGETATVTFQYIANDGHGFDGTDGVNKSSTSDPATVTLTITGTNDAPVLSSENTTGAVTEDASNPTLTDSGNIVFTDVDVSDTHTVHVEPNPTNIGTLSAIVNEDPNSDHGAVSWTYNVDNSAVQYLGAGETKTESFNVTVSDEHGGISTQTVDIAITGTNDAPAITAIGDASMTFLSESAGYNNVLGVYTFDDNGNPTNPQIVLTGTNNPDNLGVSHQLGLPMGSFGLFLISNGETVYPDIANSSVSFDLSGTNPVLLINGVASTRPVYFDNNQWNPDGHDHFDTTVNPDGSLTVAIEDLSMGDNDRMDLVVNLKADGNSVGGTVVEIADGVPGENIDNISTSGTLSFSDADLTDLHTVSATPNDSGYLGTFTPTIVTSSAGSGEGEIEWSFSVNDSLVDHLGADESIVQTYTVVIDDGHGGTATQDVSVVIQGTNDRPIAVADTGHTTENTPLVIDALANDTDADMHDTISINSFDTTTSGGGTVSLVDGKLLFDPGHDFDHLGVGETQTVTFNYTAKDDSLYMTSGSVTANHGISDPATVTLTITGTNDAPIAVASSGEFNEDQLSEPIVPVEGSENLLTGVLDADVSDTNHFVSQVGNSDGSYQSVDATDGTLVKVSFDFIDAQGNHENIFIPVRVNQDGTYDVSQNELLNKIPQGTDAVGSFWYKVDDGHTQNHLSDGKEFTIHIHGQNDAPEVNITSLDNTTGDSTNDIPVIVKLSGDRFNTETGDAPKFNIIVDGHQINDNPLTIDQFRSYNIDSSLGSEPRETSWEYVTFNVANDTQSVAIQFVNDAYEGGHDVDGDGYTEDRNLIVDYINVGGKIVTDSSGEVAVVGGSTLQAEDPSVSTYTVSNGVDASGIETMPWAGTMDFNVANSTATATPVDAFHTETISENSIVANGTTSSDVNLLDGAIDVDGLKSDMSVVKGDGTDFTGSFVVNLNANDANGDPLTLDVTVNPDGTYYIAQNDALNSLSAGTVVEGSFDFRVKDADGGLSSDQTSTIKIMGTNDQPVVQDVNISTTLVAQNSTDGNLGVFSGVFSETGESSPTFGGEKVSQTYDLGAEYAGKTVTINFDMKELGTWDGDGIWNHVNEANMEKFIIFVNGEKVVDKVMGLDGLDGNSDDGGTIIAGQAGTHVQTDLHHFSVQAVVDDNGQVTLGFGSTLHEGLQNESYSIDNILIVSGQTIYEAVHGNTVYNGDLPAVSDADVGDIHTFDLVSGSEHVSNANITDYSISVDPDGHFTLNGDFNSLAAGETATVTFQYTANDGHGFDGTDGINESSISDPKTVTLTIIGTNDAPVIDLDGSSNTYKESFENLIDSHGWTVIQEPAFMGDHGIAWQTAGGHHGLEVQYGNIGDSSASDGNVHAELDSDQLVTLSTNIYISADTAELKFDYKPRPYHENDSDMKVKLGGTEFVIHHDGTISDYSVAGGNAPENGAFGTPTVVMNDNGWMSVAVDVTALAGGETTLTFQGLGDSDSFGAYLDNISLVNSSVSGDNGYDTTYVEDGSPIAIVDSDITISDVDGDHIGNATVTLTNAFDGDVLHVGGMPVGIVATTSTDGHSVTLTGDASLADYQDALKSITYENTSSDTNETNRVIEVVVNDGHDNSNTAISTIHVLSNTLVGGDGNDIFAYDGNPVDGGHGIDTLLFQNDTSVDLSQIDSGAIKNMEKIDLTHADVSISNLNANDVLDMTDSHNIIKIDGDAGDAVSSTSTWQHAASQTGVEAGYTRYESIADDGTTHVFVDMKDTIVHTDF